MAKFQTLYSPAPLKPLKFPVDKEGKPATLTEQHHAKSCDVNYILKKSIQGADLQTKYKPEQAIFGDFSYEKGYDAFVKAHDTVVSARQKFDRLPADIKKEFGNNPRHLLDAFADKSKYPKLVELGLIPPPPQPKPVEPKGVDNDKSN